MACHYAVLQYVTTVGINGKGVEGANVAVMVWEGSDKIKYAVLRNRERAEKFLNKDLSWLPRWSEEMKDWDGEWVRGINEWQHGSWQVPVIGVCVLSVDETLEMMRKHHLNE